MNSLRHLKEEDERVSHRFCGGSGTISLYVVSAKNRSAERVEGITRQWGQFTLGGRPIKVLESSKMLDFRYARLFCCTTKPNPIRR